MVINMVDMETFAVWRACQEFGEDNLARSLASDVARRICPPISKNTQEARNKLKTARRIIYPSDLLCSNAAGLPVASKSRYSHDAGVTNVTWPPCLVSWRGCGETL